MTAYPRLALTGLLTFFGSLNAAVPFLLDLFRIPADTFQLFVATGVINSRFGTLTAAVHTIVVALLGSAAVAGTMRFEARRVIRYLVISGVLIVLTVSGLRVLFRTLLPQEFKGAEIVYGMTNLLEHDATRVVPQFPVEEPGGVGAGAHSRARHLARGLRRAAAPVRVPQRTRRPGGLRHRARAPAGSRSRREGGVCRVARGELAHAVTTGQCDMGIGGTPVTPMQADRDTVFRAVHRRNARVRRQGPSEGPVRDLGGDSGHQGLDHRRPGAAVLRASVEGAIARRADTGIRPSRRMRSRTARGFDAVALPAERGSVMTMLNPKWTVVVPQPDLVKIPLAFPLAGGIWPGRASSTPGSS